MNSSLPTRRQRVKYAIMGGKPKRTMHKEDLEEIETTMEDTSAVYSDLSKHHSIDERVWNLTKSYLERCEDLILEILELREIFYS